MSAELQAPDSAKRPDGTKVVGLYGIHLLIARVAWVVLAGLTLLLFIVVIPVHYGLLDSPCAGRTCVSGALTNDAVLSLRSLGLSAATYAGYIVGLEVLFAVVCGAVGLMIFCRKSHDPLALGVSLFLVLFGATASASPGGLEMLGDAYPALAFPAQEVSGLQVVLFVPLFLTLPTGTFQPPWTRWPALLWFSLWLLRALLDDGDGRLVAALRIATEGGLFPLLFLIVLVQVYRYRRVYNGLERRQMKWVVYGTVVGIALFIPAVAIVDFLDESVRPNGATLMLTATVVDGALLLIPLSFAAAILRSGLWDIDVIIRGTLVYGVLTATLAAVYLFGVVSLQAVLRALTGQGSNLAVVASTLGIAALFQPLRRRIQDLVDRRFYRSRYDAALTLQAYSAHLRDEVDLDTITSRLVALVQETVQPSQVSVWLRSPEQRP